jgi:hypothetical protein
MNYDAERLQQIQGMSNAATTFNGVYEQIFATT